MGRLDHLKQSAKALLADPRIDGVHNHYIVVDYYCPDKSGDWIKRQYGERAHVLDFNEQAPLTSGTPLFQKPLAHNSGAYEALSAFDAQYLVFLDADTVVTPTLMNFVFAHASPDRFLIFEPHHGEYRDLTGFLVVHRRAFMKVNGFDLRFQGWGAEDLELRVKLYLRGRAPLDRPRLILQQPELGMPWTEIPCELASSISHDDDRRTSNYAEQDKDVSHGKNLNLLCSNAYEWLGVHLIDLQGTPLSSRIQRLLGMDLIVNPKAIE
jgi:hypothetical protein